MKRYISLLQMLFVALIGVAQTANDTISRMVLVESTYNPIIVGASKRNFIPQEVKPSMTKEQVVYADENVDLTNFDRQAQPAQVVDVAPEKGVPGYAHLGYGNYNNLSGLAAYKWNFGGNHSLALKAHADGWNGKLKLDDGTKWRSRLYDTGLNADYKVWLGTTAVNVGAHATYYNYNYHSLVGENKVQQSNDLGTYVGVDGYIRERFHYQVAVDYTRFGRTAYMGVTTPHSENYINSDVTIDMDLYRWGIASVLVHSDVFLYQGLSTYHNYHSLGVTPRWEYRYGDFQFVSGFNMDFLGGSHIAHPVQFSPECSISYVPAKRFSALFTFDGGRDVHSFASLYERSPYWASTKQLLPTYTFLNAHLEGGLRIYEGLHLYFGGGYKLLSNALFETVMPLSGVMYTGLTNHNTQVATVNGSISYEHKEFMSLSVKSAYNHWMLKANRSLLARAPQFDTDVDFRVRLMPKLHAYTNLQWVVFTNTDVAPRERAIIDWSLGSHYALNERFTFFLDAHNLLNRRYSYYTGYPSQGFNILAGAIFKF